MGLSRKLGQGGSANALPAGLNTVTYQWSHQAYTLQEIVRKFKLPCVVQCATESCTVLWSDFHFDLGQPLLLYSRRNVRKLHARSLDPTTLEEFGPPVAIPEDYEGWFALTAKGTKKAKRHTRVQGVVDSNTSTFLVCSKCPAFTSSRDAGSSLHFLPHEIKEGEILKRICIVDDRESCGDGLSPIIQKYGPCIECLDEKGEDVLIPLAHRVMTYEIADNFPNDEHKVFHTSSIITAGNPHLPRILTLVHGSLPSLPYSYTGLYRCYTVFTEETILAATLDNMKSTCLELATDSVTKFNLVLNDAVIKKTCEYGNAFQACQSAGDKFSASIKVSFSLKTADSGTEDIDLSIYENLSTCTSDAQEVDANSEFDFTWGSGGTPNDVLPCNPYQSCHDDTYEGNSKTEVCQGEKGMKSLPHNQTCRQLESVEKKTEIIAPSEKKSVNNLDLISLPTSGETCDSISNSYSASHDNSESDDEEAYTISCDLIEMAIEETDYNTMVVKKACEYSETSQTPSDSDSDEDEDSQHVQHSLVETMETKGSSPSLNPQISVKAKDEMCLSNSDAESRLDQLNSPARFKNPDISIPQSFNRPVCGKSTQESSPSPSTSHGGDLIQFSDSTNISFPSIDNSLTRNFKIPEHNLISMSEPTPVNITEVRDCDKKAVDMSENSTQPGHILYSDEINPEVEPANSQNDHMRVKSSVLSNTHGQIVESESPFYSLERLRKFKSGSNMNVCSDLEVFTDNRFHSSKVRQHPHEHPHKMSMGGVLRLGGRGKARSPVKSLDNLHKNKNWNSTNSLQTLPTQELAKSGRNELSLSCCTKTWHEQNETRP